MIGCDCEVCSSDNSKDRRLRSSILVQSKTTSIVVDSGPDFRQQMLRENVKRLDAVIFTHSHKDHIAGLDDVRAYNYYQQKPMQVYGTEFTLQRVVAEFNYAFSENKYPGTPSIHLNTIDEEVFLIGDILIQPIPVWHLRMPVMGFRFGNFTYITDANQIDEESKEKVKGSKTLVINALRKQKHISHFTLNEACMLADELGVEQTYFTHISHQLGLNDLINNELANNKQLAFDGLKIIV